MTSLSLSPSSPLLVFLLFFQLPPFSLKASKYFNAGPLYQHSPDLIMQTDGSNLCCRDSRGGGEWETQDGRKESF